MDDTAPQVMPWESLSDMLPASLATIAEAEYNATRLDYISAHRLNQFAAGPNVFKAYSDGILVDPDRPAYAFGRAAHCLILEGEGEFLQRYTVDDGPINPTTGRPYGRDTNKFQGWLAEVKQSGREPITTHEYDSIVEMSNSIESHPVAWPILGGIGTCGVERSIVSNFRGMHLRGRLDAIGLDQRVIVDLKTCEDIERFEADFRRFNYARQLAFYRRLARYLTGFQFSVYVIAVEKTGLYQCGIWEASPATLDLQDDLTDLLLLELAGCIERDEWPSRYDSCRIL